MQPIINASNKLIAIQVYVDSFWHMCNQQINGMTPIFFKSFWHIVGEDVIAVDLRALNTGNVPESFNTTFISLISKIKNPNKVSDFRPISLYNVIYKLIAKVMANRLNKFLAKSIPNSQSAFLSGWLIIDNILMVFETLHFHKRKTKGRLGYMSLKLNMSKAYDLVEWEFLERLMHHLDIEERMIKIIMSCLQSISYAILLNGQLVGNINPTRGIHQGDRLSLYLFLLCAMGLQSLMQQAEVDGHIRGAAIYRNGPQVSHLLFANDSVLFCGATEIKCEKIMDILAIYERGSGKKLNREKTNIFFSSNTSYPLQARIQHLLGVPAIHQYEKYLGLPTLVGRAKKKKKKRSFVYLKERV